MKDIDTEFTDIEKESKYKNYIIVGILYLIVVILSIFLIIGIKNQKDTVKENINNEDNTIETDQKENINDTNTDDNIDISTDESNNSSFINEFEILDQIQQ